MVTPAPRPGRRVRSGACRARHAQRVLDTHRRARLQPCGRPLPRPAPRMVLPRTQGHAVGPAHAHAILDPWRQHAETRSCRTARQRTCCRRPARACRAQPRRTGRCPRRRYPHRPSPRPARCRELSCQAHQAPPEVAFCSSCTWRAAPCDSSPRCSTGCLTRACRAGRHPAARRSMNDAENGERASSSVSHERNTRDFACVVLQRGHVFGIATPQRRLPSGGVESRLRLSSRLPAGSRQHWTAAHLQWTAVVQAG
jgi:hypothetical protein